MNERQSNLLGFIKEFNKICVDNDIEYFIGAGSALGAIRHRGFLPWDDDIDLCMKRDEWLRAKPIFKQALADNWIVVDNDDYPGYNNPIVRIVNINATEYTRSRLADGTPHGGQLEIFLLDPIPASEIGQGQYYKDFWLYCEALTDNFLVANKALNMEKFPLDEYLKNKSKAQKDSLIKKLEEKLFSYSEEECEYYHFRWGIEWIVYPKETFAKQLWVDFEDTKLPVACGFTNEFCADYGDTWMIIPEPDDQLVHSTIENPNVPYEEYEKHLEKLIDYKFYNNSRINFKRNNVIKNYHNDCIRRLYLHHDSVRTSMKYEDGVLKNIALKALEESDYDKADEALDLLRIQQEKNFERYMLATNDMELLEAALETRFVKGDWRFVEKVRKIIVNTPELITEKMENVFSTLLLGRKAYSSQFYDNLFEHKDIVYDVLNKYPQQVNMLELKHMISCYDESSNKEECLNELNNLTREMQERPTIIMLKIYCLLNLNRREDAEELYNDVKSDMKNGMVLLKLKDMIGY